MVVTSIISLIGAVSIPKFNQFKIKAGRTEAYTNLNIIHTMAENFRVENDVINGGYGRVVYYGSEKDPNDTSSDCNETVDNSMSNELGFKVGECRKLRYLYVGDFYSDSPYPFVAYAIAAKWNAPADWAGDGAPAGAVTIGSGFGVVTSGCRINDYEGYWDQIVKSSVDMAFTFTYDATTQCR